MNKVLFSPPGSDLVAMSAQFKFVFRYATRHSSFATPSRTKWQASEHGFFLRLECGALEFIKTELLSPKTYVGKLTGTPIIRSLYLRPRTYSQHVFIAINSAPKLEISQLVCYFLNTDKYAHYLGKR